MTGADNGADPSGGGPSGGGPSGASPSSAGPSSAQLDKPTARELARTRRAALMTPRERAHQLSAAVVRGIAASDEYGSATTVLTYLAFGSEVDVAALRDEGRARFAVPLTHAPDSRLTFHLLDGADLLTSRSGLREPVAAAPQVRLAEVDLVLVPGLAFDVTGARLGYGKGFYDRVLAQLATVDPTVPTVGVTLDGLVLHELPVEQHDVRVSHLATETGVRRASGRR
jgi:5-formyltetrahydrofolate cyclo-ligase